MSKLEQILTSLQNIVAPVANAMNDFGKEWWGFIITFVFIWWALNKVINIIWSAFRQARGAVNWLRGRRRARRAARSSELIATGNPIDPDWNKNDNPFPAEKQMGPARLGDVTLVGSKPGATTHKSSSLNRNDNPFPAALHNDQDVQRFAVAALARTSLEAPMPSSRAKLEKFLDEEDTPYN